MSVKAVARAGVRTIPERQNLAFRAYLEILDTGLWFRHWMSGQLRRLGLTLEQFRVLELLHREGPLRTNVIADRRWTKRQSVMNIVKPLAKRELVRCEVSRVQAGEQRRRRRVGRLTTRVGLTPKGQEFTAKVIRRQRKLAYAFLRAIDLRDVDALIRICVKLRLGDPIKLINEIMLEEPDEWWMASYKL